MANDRKAGRQFSIPAPLVKANNAGGNFSGKGSLQLSTADNTFPLPNGTEIEQWLDANFGEQFASADDRGFVIQSSAAQRPRWYRHAGRYGLLFDGVNDFMTANTGNRAMTSNGHCYVSVCFASLSDRDAGMIVAPSPFISAVRNRLYVRQADVVVGDFIEVPYPGGNQQGVLRHVSVLATPSDFTVVVDGTSLGAFTPPIPTPVNSTWYFGAQLVGNGTELAHGNSFICACSIIGRATTSAERASVDAWVQNEAFYTGPEMIGSPV
ncbi:MAG: hypothetical protein AAF713_20555 [Pseudomonadota bacterium]